MFVWSFCRSADHWSVGDGNSDTGLVDFGISDAGRLDDRLFMVGLVNCLKFGTLVHVPSAEPPRPGTKIMLKGGEFDSRASAGSMRILRPN